MPPRYHEIATPIMRFILSASKWTEHGTAGWTSPSAYFDTCKKGDSWALGGAHTYTWIRIFNKIEPICPCNTQNLSTKFRPNPFTTV